MSKEALKLALEALKQIDEAMPFPVAKFAIRQLEEALAEQPAQQEPLATLFGSLPVYDTSPPAQRKPLPYNKDDMEGLDINQRLGFKLGWKSAEEAHGIKENT